MQTPINRARWSVDESEPADVAPIRQGRVNRARGYRRAKGEALSRGQAKAASPKPKYEFEGPKDPILPA